MEIETKKLIKRTARKDLTVICRATLGKWERSGKTIRFEETESEETFKVTLPPVPYKPPQSYRVSLTTLLDYRLELHKDGWTQTEATFPELVKLFGEDGLPVPVRPELLEYMNEDADTLTDRNGLSYLFENFFDK